MSAAADHQFLSTPQPFATVLSDLRVNTGTWPPPEDELHDLAGGCVGFIQALDVWESKTHGKDVIDSHRGRIRTAQARRMLAQEIMLSPEGDISVLLSPGKDVDSDSADSRIVRVELHADVDEFQGLLHRPALALVWVDNGEDHVKWYPLKTKGAHWYMLAQLRDDVRENRLVATG